MTTDEILQDFKTNWEKMNKMAANGNITVQKMHTMSLALMAGTLVHLIERVKELESK